MGFRGMKRRKRMIYFLICLIIFVVAFIAFIFSNPLRRPVGVIRNDILKLTPIGSDMDDVLSVINRKVRSDGWRIMNISHISGYADYSRPGSPTVGAKRIVVHMGRSRTGWIAVTVSWGFDEEGKLIDVYVRKHNTFLT